MRRLPQSLPRSLLGLFLAASASTASTEAAGAVLIPAELVPQQVIDSLVVEEPGTSGRAIRNGFDGRVVARIPPDYPREGSLLLAQLDNESVAIVTDLFVSPPGTLDFWREPLLEVFSSDGEKKDSLFGGLKARLDELDIEVDVFRLAASGHGRYVIGLSDDLAYRLVVWDLQDQETWITEAWELSWVDDFIVHPERPLVALVVEVSGEVDPATGLEGSATRLVVFDVETRREVFDDIVPFDATGGATTSGDGRQLVLRIAGGVVLVDWEELARGRIERRVVETPFGGRGVVALSADHVLAVGPNLMQIDERWSQEIVTDVVPTAFRIEPDRVLAVDDDGVLHTWPVETPDASPPPEEPPPLETVIQLGPPNVWSMHTDPEGQRLYVVDGQSGLRVWDLGVRREVQRVPGVEEARLSEDGSRLVTERNGRLEMRDAMSLVVQASTDVPPELLEASPSGERAAGRSDFDVSVWDFTSREQWTIRDGADRAFAFDGEDHLWVSQNSAVDDRTWIRRYSLIDREFDRKFETTGEALAWDPTTRRLLVTDESTGLEPYAATLLDEQGRTLGRIAIPPQPSGLGLLGTARVTGFESGTGRITGYRETTRTTAGGVSESGWEYLVLNVDGTTESSVWMGRPSYFEPLDGPWGATLTRDGGYVTDGTRFWHRADDRPAFDLPRGALAPWEARFSADGSRVMVRYPNEVRVWSLGTARESLRAYHPDAVSGVGDIQAAAISADGRRLLTVASYKAVLWDVASGARIATYDGSVVEGPHMGGGFTPDGEVWLYVRGLREGAPQFVRILRANGSVVDERPTTLSRYPNVVRQLPDGRWIAVVEEGEDFSERRRQLRDVETDEVLWDAGQWGAVTLPGGVMDAPIAYFGLDSHALSANGARVSRALGDSVISVFDAAGDLVREIGHAPETFFLDLTHDGRYMLSTDDDRFVRLWDVEKGLELVRYAAADPEGFVLLTPDQFYSADRQGLEAIAFRYGERAVGFEQLDALRNRPDVVLSQLPGADPLLVEAYRGARAMRIESRGLDTLAIRFTGERPTVRIQPTIAAPTVASSDFRVRVDAEAGESELVAAFVHVNGVPALQRDLTGTAWQAELELELSPGENRIEVTVAAESGTESVPAEYEVTLDSDDRGDLYILTIGISSYKDSRFDLRYAAKDAEDVAEALAGAMGPSFDAVHVLPPLTDSAATRDAILESADFLGRAGVADQIVVFFAGHGLLDEELRFRFAPHDHDFDGDETTGISYSDIEGLLTASKARRKILLLDSCHSGEVDPSWLAPDETKETQGGTVTVQTFPPRSRSVRSVGQTNTFALLKELFVDVQRGSGMTVLSAAAGQEFAFESPYWNNGVFTYALLRGLERARFTEEIGADADRDGLLTLAEWGRFVSQTVVELTDGHQHPTFRRSNTRVDLLVTSR